MIFSSLVLISDANLRARNIRKLTSLLIISSFVVQRTLINPVTPKI